MTDMRPAGVSDAGPLARLAARTFTETFGHLYRPEDLSAFLAQHDEVRWASELSRPDFAVMLAEQDGVPIGYAKLGPPSLPREPGGNPVELRQLYVLRPWHGKAVATRLMDWTIAEARHRGADALILSVFVDNVRAQRFYARYGFRRTGSYVFMVGSHADEDHVMRMAL